MGLKQLSKLFTNSNKIVDIKALKKHPKYKKFDFGEQQEPTKEQLKSAQINRDINSSITLFKRMSLKQIEVKQFSTIFTQRIAECLHQLHQKQISFIQKVSSLFEMVMLEDYQ
ncbi:Hypothetical_protein [Hexamita inflata]|uniref:Hypothetical_protein n=1 Tax=Hexamita inflata TaxID=28002 RepID=A0AA86N4Q8_9EUKA|nr:Hypothetical protein HINF_LOCUS351 [Hexamita inflata]